MSATYEIRDPIHKTIIIDEPERLVVDHPWIQRLRHIKQLGLVSLVYPGAVHDRFQHSLGVMHLGASMFEGLVHGQKKSFSDFDAADLEYARRLMRFAGLLHDCGHAPFSHTSEAWLPAVEAIALPHAWYHPKLQPKDRQATHEDMTIAVIAALVDEQVLSAEQAQDIAAVLNSAIAPSKRLQNLGPLLGIMRALISGEIDADRCDYLLRDSHYTGVSYGVYDLSRLLACLCLVDGPDGLELGLDVHGVHPLESVLLARYHMFLQVYFHKTPPAFEYYLERAIAEGEIELSFAGGIQDLVTMRDDTVYSQLIDGWRKKLPWCTRIITREPAKLVLRERMGAQHKENELADDLLAGLREAGCHVFTRRSKQVFSKLAGAGPIDGHKGARLLCERRVLGFPVVEPITEHSELLTRFNAPIDIQHSYVLRDDEAQAQLVMKRLLS